MNSIRRALALATVAALTDCNVPDKQYQATLKLTVAGLSGSSIVGEWVDAQGSGTHFTNTVSEHKLDFRPGGIGTHRYTIIEAGKIEHTDAAPLTWTQLGPGQFRAHLEPAGSLMSGRVKGDLTLRPVGDQLLDTTRHKTYARQGSAAAAEEYVSAQAEIDEDHNVLGGMLAVGASAAAGAVIGKAAINNPDATKAILEGVSKAALNNSTSANPPVGGIVPGDASVQRYNMTIKKPGGGWDEVRNVTKAEADQLRKAADMIRAPGAPDPYGPLEPIQSSAPPSYMRVK